MKIHSLIIKDNVVVDKAVGPTLLTWHPIDHDLILEDVNKNVPIDAIFDPITGQFSIIARPYDEPEENFGEEV
jgi:hypothetical protein